MTLSEFKAWFEGFTENLDGAPSAKQFEKIKAKVGEITGAPVTERTYIDKYVMPNRPYWEHRYAEMGMGVAVTYPTFAEVAEEIRASKAPKVFDSVAAMYEAGKMEATH